MVPSSNFENAFAATTKACQTQQRHQRGLTCKVIDVFCACRQGGKGHHSPHTPPLGKKQHRQPTAQHSTARRRTRGHREGKANTNSTAKRQQSTTAQAPHDSTAPQHTTQGSRAPQPAQQGTAAHRAEKTGSAQHEGNSTTAGRHHHRAKNSKSTNCTTQHSTTGHRRAKQAPTARQHDSRA